MKFTVNDSLHTAFHGGQSKSVTINVECAEFSDGVCTKAGYARIKTVHGDGVLEWINAGESFKPDFILPVGGIAPGEYNWITRR